MIITEREQYIYCLGKTMKPFFGYEKTTDVK